MAVLALLSDDPFLTAAVGQRFTGKGHTVLVCRSGCELQQALRSVSVDFLLLDGESLNGDLPRGLVDSYPPVAIVLPDAGDAGEAAIARLAGLNGALVLSFARPVALSLLEEAVLTRVEAGAVRRRSGPFHLSHTTRSLRYGNLHVPLTPLEYQLLRRLMEQEGSPVPASTLLEEVWGVPAAAGSTETVRAHIRNLRRKLRQAGGLDWCLQTCPRHGYRFVGMSEVAARAAMRAANDS